MEFIGPEIEENGGNVKKAIESVGDFVSDVVWNDILEQAQLSHTKSERWKLKKAAHPPTTQFESKSTF